MRDAGALRDLLRDIERVDDLIESALEAARIPGAAIAVVIGEDVAFTKGYGWRDLELRLPMTADTVYPIASTTKAINATVLGLLAERRQLAWDAAVQKYLPRFRLQDPLASNQATLRDLVVMRTGLPRHDFVWFENPVGRADLVELLEHLPLSTGFRERFQYNNLMVTLAGHIAEVVTERDWEDLVREHILEPLEMRDTAFAPPATGAVTLSYHEDSHRELVRTRRIDTRMTAPAGGAIHSTVTDMARWIAVNLNGGALRGSRLIAAATLNELHSPCIAMGTDPAAPSTNAAYGLGWAIDTYRGYRRISHGGNLHDVISSVTLFPEMGLGMVSFMNLAIPRFAKVLNQCAFDLLMGLESPQAIGTALAEYEATIENARLRRMRVHRIAGTSPSHNLDEYVGSYWHAAYGLVEIGRKGDTLIFRRHSLVLPLEHWHYDAWAVADHEMFQIHKPHAFDRTNRIVFETNADGAIDAFRMPLEPAVAAPARFVKSQS